MSPQCLRRPALRRGGNEQGQKAQIDQPLHRSGGLDYGFEAAGIDTGVALEMDADCCVTLRHNRGWPVIEKSIADVPTAELLAAAKSKPGAVDLVIGGPPCQPFSKSGYWASGDTKRLLDPRATTLGAYLRVVEEALPRAFLLENVEGLGYRGKNEGLALIERSIAEINKKNGTRYTLSSQVLDAADYGVPQYRRRMFVIALREGTPFRFPEPTHGSIEGANLLSKVTQHVRAWDALHNLPSEPNEDLSIRGKWAKLLPTIPEGENYLWHTDRKGHWAARRSLSSAAALDLHPLDARLAVAQDAAQR